MKGYILPFLKKGGLGITKNYKEITLTVITAKVYKDLLLSCIQLDIKKILWKNHNGFQRNYSTT